MANQKFTVNLTAVFGAKSYAEAQTWIMNQLMEGEEQTNMNIQRCDLVRWSDPYSNKPIDIKTGKVIEPEDE